MKRNALIPGSFAPPTMGHYDLIKRAADIFDRVFVVSFINTEKAISDEYLIAHRTELLCALRDELCAEGVTNVEISVSDGLCADFVRQNGIDCLVKGIRCASDFDYELTLSIIMRKFCPELDTVWLPVRPEFLHLSSSYVRDLIKFNCPLTDAVPPRVAAVIQR